jgi:pyrroline-5-carboxylate reductase
MKVGFVGAGNMAAAMARGWAAAGRGPKSMAFFDVDADRASSLASEVGGEVSPGNRELAASADVVLLAVKPAALEAVAQDMSGSATAILSMLGATPIARVQEAFPEGRIIRIVPNQPVEVGTGVICLCAADDVPAELENSVTRLLSPLAEVVPLDEAMLDAALAVMSCSPAYVAEFAEALSDAGVEYGLEPDVARRLVAATVAGTGELLRRRGPDEVRRAVATPGGITEAGLQALEHEGMARAVREAVDVTMRKMRA